MTITTFGDVPGALFTAAAAVAVTVAAPAPPLVGGGTSHLSRHRMEWRGWAGGLLTSNVLQEVALGGGALQLLPEVGMGDVDELPRPLPEAAPEEMGDAVLRDHVVDVGPGGDHP